MTQYISGYSTEIIFSSLFYKMLLQRVKVIKGQLIQPSNSTIKRLTLTYMNPLIEQQVDNFRIHIKNKFKFLIQKDTTVFLLVDEIYLQPYFDYKCFCFYV